METLKIKRRRNYLTMLGITLWEQPNKEMILPGANPSALENQNEDIAPHEQTAFIHPKSTPQTNIASNWIILENTVQNCRACPLHHTRIKSVFGAGNQQAAWLIIGDTPSREDDQNGTPFIGPPGQLLDKMLNAISLSREQVYLTNVLKSHPPENRTPHITEINACRVYLEQQIALIQPQIILSCGALAVQTLINTQDSLNMLRGHIHHYGIIPLIATYHPSYLLENNQEKRKAWDDLRLAWRVFNRVSPDGQIL